ncbi:hypothetical protein [Kiloniella majae]|uniref:hypothetical protein n=1 Tax=Kiloniella majae TaxID=1938558 RepID=UPI000A27899A|nr:hypothetical protein [Kiloniella majae]
MTQATNELLISLTTLILAGSVIVVLIIGHLNRKSGKDGETRGIGWQFIRYTVLSIALPIVAILALNGALEGEAATIIAGALGYAFGKKDDS